MKRNAIARELLGLARKNLNKLPKTTIALETSAEP